MPNNYSNFTRRNNRNNITTNILKMLNNSNYTNHNKKVIRTRVSNPKRYGKYLNNIHSKLFRNKTAKNESRRLISELDGLLKHKLLSKVTLTLISLKLNTYDTSNKNLEAYITQAKDSICEHEQSIKRDKKEGELNGPNMEEGFKSIGPQPSNISFCPMYRANA